MSNSPSPEQTADYNTRQAAEHDGRHFLGLIAHMAQGGIPTIVIDHLVALKPEDGMRVANMMVMLAGCCVVDNPAAWAGTLVEYLTEARSAMREHAIQVADAKPMLGERH